jgi:hypothetical protein
MSEAQAPAPERRGILRLLWGIVVRPRATLEYLNEHGKRAWWLPALLAVLLLILPIVAAVPITTQQAREAILAAQGQQGEQVEAEMSAEQQAQMEQAMSIAASPLITVVLPSVGVLIVRVVGWLAWAGALYLAGIALGGRSTFGQVFRMVVWVWLPYTLSGLLQTVYILASGQLITNPGLSGLVKQPQPTGEMVTSSITRVLAPASLGQTLLAAILSKVDLFLVWNLVLLVIGVMVTTRLPRRKAALVTLGVWLILTAVRLIPSLVGSLAMRGLGM